VNGQNEEALKQIHTALALGIRDARFFRHAGEIALASGDRPAAEGYVRQSAELNAPGVRTGGWPWSGFRSRRQGWKSPRNHQLRWQPQKNRGGRLEDLQLAYEAEIGSRSARAPSRSNRRCFHKDFATLVGIDLSGDRTTVASGLRMPNTDKLR